MTGNFYKLMGPVIYLLDLCLILFFHDRLVPIVEIWLPHSDEPWMASVTGSDIMAFVMVLMLFGAHVLSWVLLFTGSAKLWEKPEDTGGGYILRLICLGILILVPMAEIGLTLKLFSEQQSDAFSSLRPSETAFADQLVNLGLGVVVGFVTSLMTFLSAHVVALTVQRRDEKDAHDLLASAARRDDSSPAIFSKKKEASS